MANYVAPSLTDALNRWVHALPIDVATEMHIESGLRAGSITIDSGDTSFELILTNVQAVAATSLEDVQDAFAQFINAPRDAAVLATEVERLRAKVDALTEQIAGD